DGGSVLVDRLWTIVSRLVDRAEAEMRLGEFRRLTNDRQELSLGGGDITAGVERRAKPIAERDIRGIELETLAKRRGRGLEIRAFQRLHASMFERHDAFDHLIVLLQQRIRQVRIDAA